MTKLKLLLAVLLACLALQNVQAEVRLKPFILADTQGADMTSAIATVKEKLSANGFDVIGEYSPYSTTHIIAVTTTALKNAAAQTDFGAFGAAQRVTLTKGGKGGIQVGYTNPLYFSAAYRMKDDLSAVSAQLEKALGKQKDYGSDKGLTVKELGDYQYKWLMPYFTDRLELAEHNSYDQVIEMIEDNLAAGKGGTQKVYRIDIRGGETTVFGVAMAGKLEECAGDEYIMSRIDFKDTRSSGHLPYEIVVKGNKAYALSAEFRIAISFPDLSMMGSNSFASIMCAPNAIEVTLATVAGKKRDEGGY